MKQKGLVDYYSKMREADKALTEAKANPYTTPHTLEYLTKLFDAARQEYLAHCEDSPDR